MSSSTSHRPRRTLVTGSRLRRTAVATLIAGAAGIAGLTGQATADPSKMKLTGNIETLLAAGGDCAAPAGLCFAGDVKGVLSGSIEGEINTITPTQQADVSLVDATTTIHTHDGDLNFAHEQVVYNTNPTGRGEFSWILEITSGTGRYAGATGYVQGAGNAPPSTGVSTSTYAGEITLH